MHSWYNSHMRDIHGFEGLYAVCDTGNIWGHRQSKYLKPWLIGHGYEMVMLYKDKKPSKYLVHRLIAQVFIPNPENLREVNHKNANRRDNRPENLEWVSSKENKRHAIALGLYKNLGKNTPKGSNHPCSKLTEEQVVQIRSRVARGEFKRALAREYGVSDSLVRAIVTGRTWKHV